jgi:hypothetical protein
MTISELQSLLDSGQFHHAYYGNRRLFTEGLFICKKNPDEHDGYSLAGVFSRVRKDDIMGAYRLLDRLGLAPDDEITKRLPLLDTVALWRIPRT